MALFCAASERRGGGFGFAHNYLTSLTKGIIYIKRMSSRPQHRDKGPAVHLRGAEVGPLFRVELPSQILPGSSSAGSGAAAQRDTAGWVLFFSWVFPKLARDQANRCGCPVWRRRDFTGDRTPSQLRVIRTALGVGDTQEGRPKDLSRRRVRINGTSSTRGA